MPIVFYCTLKRYLEEIAAIEAQKPILERRHVPTLKDISRETNMHYTTISRIANNKVRKLDYGTAAKIVTVLRNRGFIMKVSDILDYKIIEDE